MPKRGKKYVDAAQASRPRTVPRARPKRSTWSRAWPRPSSTRPSSWPSAWASTPARPIRWFGAPWPCPSGTGKAVRVAVFAAGEAAEAARAAGADVVGADDLVARVDGGFMDFDVAIATPDLMGQVGRLGRKLGPRGLMPNPKTGTVTTDVGRAVAEFKGGRVEYRADTRSRGVVQVPIGRVSFDRDQLLVNFRAVVDELQAGEASGGQGPVHQVDRRVVDHGPRRRRRPQPAPGDRRGAGGRRRLTRPASCW